MFSVTDLGGCDLCISRFRWWCNRCYRLKGGDWCNGCYRLKGGDWCNGCYRLKGSGLFCGPQAERMAFSV